MWFTNDVLVISEPHPSGDVWLMLRGNRTDFRFEEFTTREEAVNAAQAIDAAVSMSSGLVGITLIKLSETQVSTIKDKASYVPLVEQEYMNHSRGSGSRKSTR